MGYSIKELIFVLLYGLTIGLLVSYLIFAAIHFGLIFRFTSTSIFLVLFLINIKRLKYFPVSLRIFGIGFTTAVFAIPVLGLLGSIWIFISDDNYTGYYETIFLYFTLPLVTVGITGIYVTRLIFHESAFSDRMDQIIEGLKILAGTEKI